MIILSSSFAREGNQLMFIIFFSNLKDTMDVVATSFSVTALSWESSRRRLFVEAIRRGERNQDIFRVTETDIGHF